AQATIDRLIAIGGTSERYSLLGSLHKRRAQGYQTAERRRALEAMVAAYAKAGGSGRWYPLLNVVTGQLALRWNGATVPDAEVESGLAELDRLADEVEASAASDFWSLVFHGDLALVKALARESLDAERGAIEGA